MILQWFRWTMSPSALLHLPSTRRRAIRRGVSAFELFLAFPVLFTVFLAIVQFAMLLMAGQAIKAAASAGAREAVLPNATRASVEAVVKRSVASWRFASELDPVVIEVGGLPEFVVPLSKARSGDPIAITLSVRSSAAAPDLLRFLGISLADQQLATTFVMRKE